MAPSKTSDTLDPGRITPGQVELILSQIETLPTLPPIAARLLEMTTGDRHGTGDIAALVESDQSLSARILSLLRKSDLGARVDTIDRAVVLLGSDAVRNLVLGVQVFEAFGRDGDGGAGRFDRVGFWRHSLAVGCAARLMAEKRRANIAAKRGARSGGPAARPEEAFLGALLHDLGKVVFDACFPKSYERVIEKVESRRVDIADVEREVFGVDHAVAGHRLALHWKLPPFVAECMWLHHQAAELTPTRIGYPDHVLLVQAADRLVRQMHLGYSGNHGQDSPAAELFEAVGLGPELVDEVMRDLPEAIEARAELLGLHQVTSRELLHETLVRTNAELARVNAALALANRRLEQRSRALDAITTVNRSLGGEDRHESVAGAVARGVRMLLPSTPVVVMVSSPSRGLTVLAAANGEADLRIEVLPTEAAGHGHPLRLAVPGNKPVEALPASAGTGATQLGTLLTGSMVDRLTTLLAGRAPQYCRTMACEGELTAALVAAESVPEETDLSLGLVCDWAASWFRAAESNHLSQQLSEELAELNRRSVKAQGEVARMRSLAMVGEMAAGAAHELNNPLAVISGRAQLLARGGGGEEVVRAAGIIAEHAQRASDMVNGLMEFAKPSPAKPCAWSPAELLREVRQDWLERGALTHDEFVLELSDDLPRVWADAAQIRLLFDEIIRNAVEAMQDRADRRLSVNCHADLADERLVIRIEDNGCGMTPEVAERATAPFFSHRPAGRGRGLGLSRAARYAEINQGKIRLSSQVKEGTAVIVELPVAAAE